MDADQLKNAIKIHEMWLANGEGTRANLCGANLCGANLRGANLRGADLRDANLRGADLRGANLRDANLYGANLRGANLRDANLRDANLYGANLRGANLRDANLYGADLRDANLRDANLRDAIIERGFVMTAENKFHYVVNIGSENGTIELYKCVEGWYIVRGCFRGSKSEFLTAVDETHGDNEHGVKYRKIIELFCD